MAIRYEEVEPTVVIEIKETISPANIRNRRGRDARHKGSISEAHVAIIGIQNCVLIVEMRDCNGVTSAVQVVAQRQAHVGLFQPIPIQSRASDKSDVSEMPFSIVVFEVVWLAIIGDEQVQTSVTVEVLPHRGQSKPILGVVHPFLL